MTVLWTHETVCVNDSFLAISNCMIYFSIWFYSLFGPHIHIVSTQRCVVRGIALSSLLSCRLLANLNSRGSPVAPTCADPEAEASTGQFTRVWSGGRVLRGGATRSIVSGVSPGAWTRAHNQRLKQAALSLPGESVSRGFADRGALEGYPSHYTSLVHIRIILSICFCYPAAYVHQTVYTESESMSVSLIPLKCDIALKLCKILMESSAISRHDRNT